MAFDAVRFLQDYNLPIFIGTRNVGRNYVGTTCPFCDDTEDHFGFPLTEGRQPYCWKCGKHNLWESVKTLTGMHPGPILEEYGVVLTDMGVYTPERGKATKIEIPGGELKKAHKTYLDARGFDPSYLLHKYDLRATNTVTWPQNRIIVPIRYNGRYVSYQGRVYYPVDKNVPRYLTCPPEKEVVFHKHIFFGLDDVTGDTAIVVEGLFDQFRMGRNSIASFGTSLTTEQVNLLAQRFNRVFFLFDPEEQAQKKALMALRSLSAMGVEVERVNLGTGDPGDLSEDDALYLKKELGVL